MMPNAALAPLVVDPSGEITLQSPSPDRVWALTAFSELVDLGRESHYRLTPGSLGAALATGVELDQIVRFLERGSRQPLPHELAANLATWARGYRRIRMRRAVILRPDDAAERPILLQALREAGWTAEPLGDLAVLVSLAHEATDVDQGEEALIGALRAAGHAPRWATVSEDIASTLGLFCRPHWPGHGTDRRLSFRVPRRNRRAWRRRVGPCWRLFAPHPRRVPSRDGRRREWRKCRKDPEQAAKQYGEQPVCTGRGRVWRARADPLLQKPGRRHRAGAGRGAGRESSWSTSRMRCGARVSTCSSRAVSSSRAVRSTCQGRASRSMAARRTSFSTRTPKRREPTPRAWTRPM